LQIICKDRDNGCYANLLLFLLVTLTQVKPLQTTNFSYTKRYSNQSGPSEYISGVRLPLPTYSSTLSIESFVRDSGRTLVRAEYGYPKGSPITYG
jgi:hypothetical protein